MLFVDTEEEFDWSRPFRHSHVQTSAIAALPGAHRRFVESGIRPTYLVDYPVINSETSGAVIRELADGGDAFVGAQLHPWVNPPLEEDISDRNSFAGNLPVDLERAKLRMLTLRIEQMTGRRPFVYRAGRYGVGPRTAGLLIEQGYRLDVSVRPLFDYRRSGGPDFTHHPIWPWWVDERHTLLELPLGRGLLARAGLLQRVALTPEDMPLRDAIAAIRLMIEEGVELFSLSYHSPSVEPGHTPYVRDAADLKTFWTWWDGILDLFAREGILPADPRMLLDSVDASH